MLGEALAEPMENANWRNMLGVLPFGTEYDDPGEPGPLEVFDDKINKVLNSDGNFLEKAWDMCIEAGKAL